MSEVATIEELGVSPTDLNETPPEYDLQNAIDRIAELCGGDRQKAYERCHDLLCETLLVEPKQ